jgi:hypothetical protein
MAFWDFFTSRHVRWLEAEIKDLKKAHAEELDRVITESDRLRGEIDRFRLYFAPGLPPIGQPIGTTEEAPKPGQNGEEVTYAGTPWMRILQSELAKQEADYRARRTRPVAPEKEPEKEASNGGPSEGRNETPLSEPSKSP